MNGQLNGSADPRKVVPRADTTERSSRTLGLPNFSLLVPGVSAASKICPETRSSDCPMTAVGLGER
jgi:hypothetical protein